MGRIRRHRYIAAILMANPKNLDTLALKPFTTEDISKGLSIIFLVHSSDLDKILMCENCENTLTCLILFFSLVFFYFIKLN